VEIEKATTTVKVLAAPFGKPTAGDITELVVKIPEAFLGNETAVIEPEFAESLALGPVKLGENIRVLTWSRREDTVVLQLTTYVPSKIDIPSVAFRAEGKVIFVSEPQTIEYRTVGQSEKQLEIYHPQSAALPQWVWLGLSFATLIFVVGCIIFIARWYRRKQQKLRDLAAIPRVLTPHEALLEAVNSLNKKNYLINRRFKAHYFALSDAAKKFLADKLRIDAEEKTTRELHRELQRVLLDHSLADDWRGIFEELDIVKFTDQQPVDLQASDIANRILKLAERTS